MPRLFAPPWTEAFSGLNAQPVARQQDKLYVCPIYSGVGTSPTGQPVRWLAGMRKAMQ